MDPLIGPNFERYQVIGRLKQGAFWDVYEGYDPKFQRAVVIKILRSQFSEQMDVQQQFLNEARTVVRLRHPGLVRFYDFGQSGDRLYLVAEFLPGANLARLLTDLRAAGQWPGLTEALLLTHQACLALDYAHIRGLHYFEFGPADLMLRGAGAEDPAAAGRPLNSLPPLPYQPVLIDLGLGRLRASTTQALVVNRAQQPPPDDLYALCVLLYELLTGQPPFAASVAPSGAEAAHPPAASQLHLPAPVKDLMLKALAVDPGDRYPDPAAMAQALEEILPAVAAQDPLLLVAGAVTPLFAAYRRSISGSQAGAASASPIPAAAASLPTKPTLSSDAAAQVPPPDASMGAIAPSAEPSAAAAASPGASSAPAAPSANLRLLFPDQTTRLVPFKDGMTIGRAPDNALPLDLPQMAPYHARLNFDGSNFLVTDLHSSSGTFLGAARLLPDTPQVWSADSPLRIGGLQLFLQTAGSQPQPAPAVSPAIPVPPPATAGTPATAETPPTVGPPAALPPAGIDVTIETPALALTPGEKGLLQLTLMNPTVSAAECSLTLTGLPPGWLVSSVGPIMLLPGAFRLVELAIKPPRTPQSRAGRLPIAVQVTRLDRPSQPLEVKTNLSVAAFSYFRSDIKPRQLQAGQSLEIRLDNLGNIPETITVDLSDPDGALAFTPPAFQLTLQPGQEMAVSARVAPRQPFIFGAEPRRHKLVARVSVPAKDTQTHSAEVSVPALLPTWIIPALLGVCLLVSCVGLVLAGSIVRQASQATRTVAAAQTGLAQIVLATGQAYTATAQFVAGSSQSTLQALTATASWLAADDDLDGLRNSQELELRTLPNQRDTDSDGVDDGDEINRRLNPLKPDTDEDGLSDGDEISRGLDPLKKDTDGDGIIDGSDPDPGRAPTPTSSATPSPSATASPSRTASPTQATPTPTRTATVTVTPLATATATASGTPTQTLVPLPVLSGLSQASALVGNGPLSLGVNGQQFVTGSVFYWNGAPRVTNYVDPVSLIASLPASDFTIAGVYPVMVINPAPGGGTSAALNFTVANPAPILNDLTPSSTTAGSSAFQLVVSGANFIAGSKVRWDGADLPTSFENATQLTAFVGAEKLAAGALVQVTVFSPGPGGGVTTARIFPINNLIPELTNLEPITATLGGPTVTLTLTGTQFVPTSVVRWGNLDLETFFVSSSLLTATLPASALATAGEISLAVFNPAPAGGSSQSLQFKVEAPPPAGSAPAREQVLSEAAPPNQGCCTPASNRRRSSIPLAGAAAATTEERPGSRGTATSGPF